ncbi:chorismate mutase [Pseudoruegeria sp. SHC-113]|uniref:chorismate mutase n=1 Tax=Pseudoruegeria sp. SHC-113 TaxID=2855439 RepID=UPI00396474A3
MRAAQDCHSMRELRVAIDALDAELVALLAKRMGYIDRAVELKPAEGLPARIPARVDAVIENVRREAAGRGLDPELAAALWTQLIDWSIAREAQTITPE